MALSLGFWGLGLFLNKSEYIDSENTLWNVLCIAGIIVAAALALTNIVGKNVIYNKISKMKMRDGYNWSEKVKADIENDFKRAEKSVRLTVIIAYAYVVAVILLLTFISFGTGLLFSDGDSLAGAIPIMIIVIFAEWGLIDVFFTPLNSPAPPKGFLLDESEFPLIYATAREAGKKSGCNLKIKIYFYGDDASVSVCGDSAIICVNHLYAALLTRDELYSIMLHEFAHIVNADVKRNKAFYRAEQRFDSDGNGGNPIVTFGKVLFLPLPACAILIKTNAYKTFATRHHETEADKALNSGDKQNSANALIKTEMIALFQQDTHRELEYDFFAPEQPTGDYAERELALFMKHREKYGEQWCAEIERKLPARSESHPTFSKRIQALGCESYDAYTVEVDEKYIDEQKKIISFADRCMNKINENNYAEMRESAYIERKKLIDEYNQIIENGEKIPDNRFYDFILAFYGIDDDIALSLADKAINMPNPEIAKYYKASILFKRNDGSCIGLFKDVVAHTDNEELASVCVDRIGEFALKSGDEKLLEEYRGSMPEALQEARDREARNRFNKRSEVCRCDVDDEEIKEIADGVDKDILNLISEIYIGAFTDADGNRHYPVAVRCKKKNMQMLYAKWNDWLNYFFALKGKYDFIVIPPSALARNVIKHGTRVYPNVN